MSEARKQLKVASFAQFVVAVLALAMGLRLEVAGTDIVPDGEYALLGSTIPSVTLAMLIGVLLILAGLLALHATMLGVRGANVPSRLGPHGPVNIVGVLVSLVVLVLSIGVYDAPTLGAAALAAIADALALVLGRRVLKELDR